MTRKVPSDYERQPCSASRITVKARRLLGLGSRDDRDFVLVLVCYLCVQKTAKNGLANGGPCFCMAAS